MLRSRAASGFGRCGDADAAQARNGKQDAGRHPDADQTNRSHELTAAHHEQAPVTIHRSVPAWPASTLTVFRIGL
jgi:hypothetical protein